MCSIHVRINTYADRADAMINLIFLYREVTELEFRQGTDGDAGDELKGERAADDVIAVNVLGCLEPRALDKCTKMGRKAKQPLVDLLRNSFM